jgi:hypothetical protein
MNMYLVLCTDQQDQRWYEITDEPYITDHRAAHYGPIGGWSSWRPKGREVSCPRCLKKLQTNCPKRAKG